MWFKVIEDPEQLRALGEAGLLWYYMSSLKEWLPSSNSKQTWREISTEQLRHCVRRKDYAILLED